MSDNFKNLQGQLDILKARFDEIERVTTALEKQVQNADTLYLITSALSATLNFSDIMKFLDNLFLQKFSVAQYRILLFEDHFDLQSIKEDKDLGVEWIHSNNIKPSGPLIKDAFKNKTFTYVKDISQNTHALTLPNMKKTKGALLCLPLLNDKKTVFGLLILIRKEVKSFSQDDCVFFRKITDQIAFAIDKTLVFEHTKELSITDDLTGIFNRRYFNQRYEREIQRSQRYNHAMAVILLDIDYFKKYNDINGHIMGDEVLKKVAYVLESNLRKADILARYGGEEFVILLPETTKQQARKVADKLRKKIRNTHFKNEEFQPNGKVTISLGLAVYPNDSKNLQELLQFADDALYQAKSMGRNCMAWHGMDLAEMKKAKAEKNGSDVVEKTA